MLGIIGGDSSFRDDEGAADEAVTAALAAFAAGTGSEHAALIALAGSRLLVPVVPVVAVPDEQDSADDRSGPGMTSATAYAPSGAPSPGGYAGPSDGADAGSSDGADAGPSDGMDRQARAGRSEKASEMAMPILIGIDGRQAIPAFTSVQSMARWQADARPVPVTAAGICREAAAKSCAVVVDVAGPVPFAVEGARLAAMARGEHPPGPEADPDVREIVAEVLSIRLDVEAFELAPGDDERDLVIGLRMVAGTEPDAERLAGEVADAVLARLGGRFRRGIAIWLVPPAVHRA